MTIPTAGRATSPGAIEATTAFGPAVWPEDPIDPATAGFVAQRRSGDEFHEELRSLLRARLILVHILAIALFLLLTLLSFLASRVEPDSPLRPDQGSPWRQALPLAEGLIGIAVFWCSPRMSVRSLRRWELAHFGLFTAYYALLRFEMLAYLAHSRPTQIELAFQGAVSLNGFVCLILSYGVLIPNARRRSMIIIVVMNVVPLGTTIAATALDPTLRTALPPMIVQIGVILTFPSAIAFFAASRANDLQHRAFEAERRVRQIGQYTLKRKLGEGGMGEVFLAEHHLLKRPCAVKFVRPELSGNPATAARFAKEVQAVTGLTHFNTVRVYDYGKAEDGSFYYVMEYLDGPTLDGLVQDHGPLPPGRAVYLIRQLCGALAEAHAAGLVHRDLKPGNVIVARLGGAHDVAKLLDFGLVLDESLTQSGDRFTQAGIVLGTPAYMAPEQAAGESMDGRGDVYGLGALAYYILAGRPPFDDKSALKVMAAHRTTPAPHLANAPNDLAAVIARCLAKDPEDRFPTMAALERELAGCTCAPDWSASEAMVWWEQSSHHRQTANQRETTSTAVTTGTEPPLPG